MNLFEKTAHECGFFNTILAENLEEAVKICAEKAEAGTKPAFGRELSAYL